MDAAEQPGRLLGLLLIEMGLISEEHLVQALETQQRTGELLGEILIGLGIVTRLAIQDALATQRGELLKPDPGFGGGLRSKLIRRESRRESSVDQQVVEFCEIGSPATDAPEAGIGNLQREPREGQAKGKELLQELRTQVERHEQRLTELERELETARHTLTMALRGTPPGNRSAIPVGVSEARLADDLSELFLATVGRARKHITDRRAALHQQSAAAIQP
ncbi:MAG: hypothetical protein ACXVZ2_07110 [Gaiellaceae bacterium]